MIAFLTTLLFGNVSADPAADPDTALKEWLGKRTGAVAMARVTAQGVTFHQAGQLSPEHPEPPTPDTQWEIGSVTKVFTGILLAKSEAAGKVSRNDPAAKFLLPADDPDIARFQKITLLSLTTHTSGLPRLPKNMKLWWVEDPYAKYNGKLLIEGFRKHGPVASGAEEVGYSNFGVGLLGEALGKAWGKSYAEVLPEQILQPLGLNQTTLAMAGQAAPANFAPPLEKGKTTNRWTFDSVAPAGALISSTREMALFLQACMGQRDTPLKESLEESMKPLKPTDDFPGSVGMGWFTLDGEKPVIWHNGATGGFQSFLGFCPVIKEGVVLLTNCGKGPDGFGIKLLKGNDSQEPGGR